MNSSSEPTNTGNTQSASETAEAASNTGGKSSGAGLTNTLGETTQQRVGDAGHIGPESPEIVAENVETTEAAFSSGTKPADVGQTESPAKTETTGTEQTNTSGQ